MKCYGLRFFLCGFLVMVGVFSKAAENKYPNIVKYSAYCQGWLNEKKTKTGTAVLEPSVFGTAKQLFARVANKIKFDKKVLPGEDLKKALEVTELLLGLLNKGNVQDFATLVAKVPFRSGAKSRDLSSLHLLMLAYGFKFSQLFRRSLLHSFLEEVAPSFALEVDSKRMEEDLWFIANLLDPIKVTISPQVVWASN